MRVDILFLDAIISIHIYSLYAKVFRCIDLETSNEVAVKVLRNKKERPSGGSDDEIMLAKEIRIVQTLHRASTKATGIIKIFESFEHEGHRQV